MPGKKKDQFINGQYGLDAALEQYIKALSMLRVNPVLSADLKEKAYTQSALRQSQMKMGKNDEAGIQQYEFKNAFGSTKQAEEAKKEMADFRKILQNEIKHPTDNMNKFKGYLFLIDKLLDTQSGDFGKALADNPYLSDFMSMSICGPKTSSEFSADDLVKNLDSVNPVTNQPEKGPLQAYSNFMYLTSRLIQREYDKQAIEADYSPEKEAEYLKKLNADFKGMIKNHETFERLVKEDGTSDYEAYLNNSMDYMTGKNHKNKEVRGIKGKIENVKGQQKAIENGWGMNELAFAGNVSEMVWRTEASMKYLQYVTSTAYIKEQNEKFRKNIADFKNKSEKAEAKRHTLEEELKNLQDSHAKKADIDAKQLELDNQKSICENYSRRYNGWKNEETKFANEVKENRKNLTKTRSFLLQLQELDNEIKNTNTRNNITAKIQFCEKFEKLAGQCPEGKLKEYMQEGLLYTKEAMKYAGRGKTPAVITEQVKNTTISDELYELYNPIYALMGNFCPFMSVAEPSNTLYPEFIMTYNGSDTRNKVQAILTEIYPEGDGRLSEDEKQYGPIRNGVVSVRTDYVVNKEASEVAKKALVSTHAIMDDVLFSAKGARKELNRSYAPISVATDVEKGNYMKALSENYYLFSMMTQLCGNTPNVYSDSVSAEEVTGWMKENGAMEPYNAISDAGKELFEIEYEKQRMQKTGWDDKKEKLYLAKLEENIGKTEKALEKLLSLPLDVQNRDRYLGNSIGHLTGNDDSGTTRDVLPMYEGLRWMREGIRLGWDSKDLNALMIGGVMDGTLRRGVLKVQNRMEMLGRKLKEETDKKKADKLRERIADCKDLLKKITEFRENEFKPLKESILGRKIQSPADKIKVVVQMQEFYEKVKDRPFLIGGNDLYEKNITGFNDASVGIANEKLFPDIINRNLAEIEKGKTEEAKPQQEMNFKYCNREKELLAFLTSLRGEEHADRNYYKMIAQVYLYNRFLHGMNQDAHPELFDPKHYDYKASEKMLAKCTEQYADRLVDILDPANSKDFADALEFGNHEDFFADMRDRIQAGAAKARFEAVIKGKALTDSRDKNLSNTIKVMENAHASWGSSSALYDGIVTRLKELEKMRTDLTKDLYEKSHKDHKVRVIGYEKDRNGNDILDQPIMGCDNPEEIKIPEKKLKEYLALQKETFERINLYLTQKDEIIREKGGDPKKKSDAAKLGANGEKRYNAVKDAKKAVLNLNKTTIEFNKNGMTYTERRTANLPGFDLNRYEYLDHNKKYTAEEEKQLRDNFIKGEKEKFVENLKYNLIERNKELEKTIGSPSVEQQKRNDLYEGYKAKLDAFMSLGNTASEEMKAVIQGERTRFEEAMTDSAIRTLYTEGVVKRMEDKRMALFTEIGKKDNERFEAIKNRYENDYYLLLAKYEGVDPPEEEKQKLREPFEAEKQKHEAVQKAVSETKPGTYPKMLVGMLDYKALDNLNKEYQEALSGPLENKAEYVEFKNKMLTQEPFKDEFKKNIADMCIVKSPNKDDIQKICNDIVKEAAAKKAAKEKEGPQENGPENEAPKMDAPKAAPKAMGPM